MESRVRREFCEKETLSAWMPDSSTKVIIRMLPVPMQLGRSALKLRN